MRAQWGQSAAAVIPDWLSIQIDGMRELFSLTLNGSSRGQVLRAGGQPGQDCEALTRLPVTLPRTLFCRLRLHAADQNISPSALVVRMIREELG